MALLVAQLLSAGGITPWGTYLMAEEAWKYASDSADGMCSVETEGEIRGIGRIFFRVSIGAEKCGTMFTPDDKTLFVAVQHPATDGTKDDGDVIGS